MLDDQVFRHWSVQYESDPAYPWNRLRQESPGVYQSYAPLEPGAWTRLRIEVAGTKARLYVNGASQPALSVNDLKTGASRGTIVRRLGHGPGVLTTLEHSQLRPRDCRLQRDDTLLHGATLTLQRQTVYRAHGLTVRSAISLPELALGGGMHDVDIELGDVPQVPGWRRVGPRVLGTTRQLRLEPGNRAQMLVSDGRRIVVQLGAGIAPDAVRPYLVSSAMGAILHQRASRPLHASAVRVSHGSLALMGHRGAGKSTLAAFLGMSGFPALSDDICAVSFTDGQPIVSPNRQRFKLADDAVAHLDLHRGVAERLSGGKLSVALPGVGVDVPVPLLAVFVISAASSTGLRRLDGREALSALVEHTFRPRYVVGLGIEREHLHRCAAVAATIPVYALSIVRDLSRLPEAASVVASWSQTRGERSPFGSIHFDTSRRVDAEGAT
ncbi:MAG: hypothetical protein ABI601_18080 [bacterium]